MNGLEMHLAAYLSGMVVMAVIIIAFQPPRLYR